MYFKVIFNADRMYCYVLEMCCYDYSSVLVMYWQCNTSQYIIGVLGCIARCIGMYSQMYWDVFGEVFGFINSMVIHINTSGNTSQYIAEYIIIPLKYIPIHLWCIGMLIHPKNSIYINNTSKYIPIHPLHPPRFANDNRENNSV
jgi:hypothetical protein